GPAGQSAGVRPAERGARAVQGAGAAAAQRARARDAHAELPALMPLAPGGRYRVTTTSTGKKVRLHWNRGGNVDEAKSLSSGRVHSPAEFQRDRGRRSSR